MGIYFQRNDEMADYIKTHYIGFRKDRLKTGYNINSIRKRDLPDDKKKRPLTLF